MAYIRTSSLRAFGLGGAFLIGLLGWLGISLFVPSGVLAGLALLVGPALLACSAGAVSARWLGLPFYGLGYLCGFAAYYVLRPLANVPDDSTWPIYFVIYVILPTVLAFAVGLWISRRRRAPSTDDVPV